MKAHYLVTLGERQRQAACEPLGGNRFRLHFADNHIELTAHRIRTGEYVLIYRGRVRDLLVSASGAARLVKAPRWEASLELLDEHQLACRERSLGALGRQDGGLRVSAPMPGRVVKTLVDPGDPVKRGQSLVVVEAMKMENELKSPSDGRIERVLVRSGEKVEAGQSLVVIE